MKVQLAVARKILVASYNIISKGEQYKDYNKGTDDVKLDTCT